MAGLGGKVYSKRKKGSEEGSAHSWPRSIRTHWPLYIFEGAELMLFMISACVFTVILFDPSVPIQNELPGPVWRRLLMGLSMGVTAVLIIHSPMGKRSGAHFNPAITSTYFRLGKISRPDACFYVISQFIGGVVGVGLSAPIPWEGACQSVRDVRGNSARERWNRGCLCRGGVHGGASYGSRTLDLEQAVARFTDKITWLGF